MVTRHQRKTVIEEVATDRRFALERHALCLQDGLLAEYRRVGQSLSRDEIRLEHRSNLVQVLGRAAAGVGTAIAYVILGLLLYTGQLDLALAGTAVLTMRTASSALSNAMRDVNFLHEIPSMWSSTLSCSARQRSDDPAAAVSLRRAIPARSA